MAEYVRLTEHGVRELTAQMRWHDSREAKEEVACLVRDIRGIEGIASFDVILRLPKFERHSPEWIARPSISWYATRAYAGTLDLEGMRDGMVDLRRLLMLASRDLRDPHTKPLAPGSDPTPYPRP